MRVLITGGFGYLGSYLAHGLSSRSDRQVRILAPEIPPPFESWRDRFEIVQGDVTHQEEIRGCCRGCDAVLHLAALDRWEARNNPARALQVSGAGTRNILEEALLTQVSIVIYFSTTHVYGKPWRTTIREESSVEPLDDYSIAHYLGELYCKRFRELSGLNTVRLRLSNGYGAPVHKKIRCWSLVVHDLCQSALAYEKIIVRSQGSQMRDFIPISDIEQAVNLVLSAPSYQLQYSLYHVASGVLTSINEIASRVRSVYRDVYGRDIRILHEPADPALESATPYTLDLERIRGLGFQPATPDRMDTEIRRIFALLESP